MILIDGKKIAAELREELRQEVVGLKDKHKKIPGLTVILIGDMAPSQIYVRNKEKSANEVGLKSEVIKYFINDRKLNSPNKIQEHLESEFNYFLKNEYTKNNSVKLIHPDLPDYFNNLRYNGIKVTLNTGYNKDIQNLLIDKLNMTNFIDDCISSDEVTYGRPYPFMIHKLMNRNNISDINNVIKIGDSVMDIKEGKNAGCKTVGVLSGADSRGILVEEDPDFIVSNIIDIKFI